MNGAHNTRSTSLIVGCGLPSKSQMETQPHRHSTGELKDSVRFDWDSLQLPPRNTATSSSDYLRSKSESHNRNRASSGGDVPPYRGTVLYPTTADGNAEDRQRQKSSQAKEETPDERTANTQDGEEKISDALRELQLKDDKMMLSFMRLGWDSKEDEQELVERIEKAKQTKQVAELPLAMRKASLEASLRLGTGSQGRSRYTIDSQFTSIVDNAKQQPDGGGKNINKASSMPEIKESPPMGQHLDDCLPLPSVHGARTSPSTVVSNSLYTNPFRYAAMSSRRTRQDAVNAQTQGAMDSLAYSQLASLGWW